MNETKDYATPVKDMCVSLHTENDKLYKVIIHLMYYT